MKYMNDYDIAQARQAFQDHPVLAPAVETVANLRDWANRNSDGWAYWPKPCRAAAKLIELIERDGTWEARYGNRDDATPDKLKAALVPIKSFLTRHDVPHDEIIPTMDVDTESSASRQHYIDTGRYLTHAEVAEFNTPTTTVVREYLARVVQTYEVDARELEGVEEDTSEFDDIVCSKGRMVDESIYGDLNDAELTTLYEHSIGTVRDPRS